MDDEGADEGLEARLDEAIARVRRIGARARLTAGGRPLAGREVVVEQASHRFLFGSNWGGETIALANGELEGAERELAERRNGLFLGLLDYATLPFYWARYEPERGRPDSGRVMEAARWYRARGIALKGHPLCWHTLTAPWLLELDEDGILREQLARIRREVGLFAGVVDAWDVVNEAVIMPDFDRYDNGVTRLCRKMGRVGLVKAMFEEARAANPRARLLLNDFDTSPGYERLIEGCLEAGVPIDALGIQSHMHQGWWGVAKTEDILRRFRRFGLPLHFTETTLVSGRLMPPEIVDLNDYRVDSWPSTPEGEARQAREAVLHYKALLAEPAVESITWWDLSDGGWLGAPAGLLRADRSPKPAYEALRALVRGDWWLGPTRARADSEGRIAVEGFAGDYRVEAGGLRSAFALEDGGPDEIEVRL